MANREDIDFTQSVVQAVHKQYGKEQGNRALDQMRREMLEEKKRDQDRKIIELVETFQRQLSVEQVRSVLKDVNWNVEAAIAPLTLFVQERARRAQAQPRAAPSPAAAAAPVPAESLPVSLSVPEHVELADTMTVRWTHQGVPQSTDFVALFEYGQANHAAYLTYQWIDPSLKEGAINLKSPATCGKYELRYLSKQYKLLGNSAMFTAGPVYELDARIIERRIVLNWRQTFGGDYSRSQWAALYDANESNMKSYIEFQYCAPIAGSKAGEVSFAKPLKPGQYAIRVYCASYILAAQTVQAIRVDEVDTIQARITDNLANIQVSGELRSSPESYASVWIGIYPRGAENRSYLESKYISAAKFGETFAVPKSKGVHELRMFYGRGYDCQLCTCAIEL